jgi:hypothetical protein
VAAVAKKVAEAQRVPCDVDTVVQTGLLHDMGNILKVQFNVFPEAWEPEGVQHWEQVQQAYREKYGPSEHEATVAIAREIGASEKVVGCIDMMSFVRIEAILKEGSIEEKIASYADNRVGPFGVLSLLGRLDEAKQRYMHRTDRVFDHVKHGQIVELSKQLEHVLFDGAACTPEDITDTALAPIIQELKEYTFSYNGDD